MNKLVNHLRTLSTSELDEILDKRDSDIFDCAWCSADAAIPEPVTRFNTNNIFITLSEATNSHEICSYISDDLELIHKAKVASYKSEFIDYLEKSYEEGAIPCEWED